MLRIYLINGHFNLIMPISVMVLLSNLKQQCGIYSYHTKYVFDKL